jgi:PAS domain S-box-containing protein
MRSDAVIVERSQSGKAIRMIGTQTNVTHLHHFRFALEASEQRFRTVLDAAAIGMAFIEGEGRLIRVNNAMPILTGYSKEEMLDAFTMMTIVPAEDIAHMRKALSQSTKHEYHEVYREEHSIRHKDGSLRLGLFNITWTFDKNEGSYVYIAQFNDITDQKQMDQIKSEFVSTVSHKLRMPLTSIKGALGLIHLSVKGALPATVLRLVNIARTNANRLTDIVNDILDLGKISMAEISFDLAQLDLGSIVEDGLQKMMPYAITHKKTGRRSFRHTGLCYCRPSQTDAGIGQSDLERVQILDREFRRTGESRNTGGHGHCLYSKRRTRCARSVQGPNF